MMRDDLYNSIVSIVQKNKTISSPISPQVEGRVEMVLKRSRSQNKIEINEDVERNAFVLLCTPRNDDFLKTMHCVFRTARWFGIPYGKGAFFILLCIILFSIIVAIEIGAIWKLARAVTGMANDTSGGRSVVGRLSGSIFYANALISSVLSWRLAKSWETLSLQWSWTEKTIGSKLSSDRSLKAKLNAIVWTVMVCSVVEHLLSMFSAIGFDCPPSEYFRRYVLNSHGFIMRPDEYSLFLAIPIFIASKTTTCIWNFQDTLVILIAIGLTSKYKRLNSYIRDHLKKQIGTEAYIDIIIWRRIREAYVRQAALVRKTDKELGSLILLCNLNNFYFICLQLFFGIGGEKPAFINKFYYLFSLAWLCLRACGVVLAAAGVNAHSKRALPSLHLCPKDYYNVEMQRLEKQLSKDFVALTGNGFFYLDQNLLLKVAAAILTYELVLIQYDTSS